MLARLNQPQRGCGRRSHSKRVQQENADRQHATEQEWSTTSYYGDIVGPLPENVFRFIGGNVNGLPVSARDIKNDHFFTSIRKYQVSAMAIQETGVNEGRLGRWHSLAKRIRRAFDSSCTKWFHAYNKNDITGNRQLHGGTAILSTGDCSHYAIGSGADETNLGRWCWARFRGKDQINLRVVSAYRPVDNKTGPKLCLEPTS